MMDRRSFLVAASSSLMFADAAIAADVSTTPMSPSSTTAPDIAAVLKDIKTNPTINSGAKLSKIQSHLSKPECLSCSMVIAWTHYVLAVDALNAPELSDLPPNIREKIKPNTSVEQTLKILKDAGMNTQKASIIMTKDGTTKLATFR